MISLNSVMLHLLLLPQVLCRKALFFWSHPEKDNKVRNNKQHQALLSATLLLHQKTTPKSVALLKNNIFS